MTSDLTSIQLTGIAYSAQVFEGQASESQAFALNKTLVPEPATASLSLLALAGLCARRRRK